MSNMVSGLFRDGRNFLSQAQLDGMANAYERLTGTYGDNPNAIADEMGWTRGTGCVVRRISRERGAA